MTIRAKQPTTEIVIDLDGPDGNAFALLGYARNYARQLGLDANAISEEMKASDYENLLLVFDKYFGDYVVLERSAAADDDADDDEYYKDYDHGRDMQDEPHQYESDHSVRSYIYGDGKQQ